MSAVICPSILATTETDYAAQIKRVAPFARRVQIDLMDGVFASPHSVLLENIWWPPQLEADLHLMYQQPMGYLEQIIRLKPHMAIIHAEADVHHMHFAAELHKEGILAGLAVLPKTLIDEIEDILHSFDHLMIFAGSLGSFGGQAELSQLIKAHQALEHHPQLEIGWDGGINKDNTQQLIKNGVSVLNVGSFIHNATSPAEAYATLVDTVV